MALAYLDPAAGPDHASSPHRSADLPAGSRAPLRGDTRSRRQVDLLAVAQGFAASAGDIAELRGLARRSWILLAVTDLFEAWAIGWPPGGRIELHDHGESHGAVAVATGALVESIVQPTTRGVALLGTHRIPAGQYRRFGPHYVHDIINDGDDDAVSVHVYGPRLDTMTYYRLDGRGRLEAGRTEHVVPVGPFDTTSAHDPS